MNNLPDRILNIIEKAKPLANHNLKYVLAISNNVRELIERLESKGDREKVRLRRLSSNYREEMDVVAAAGETQEEKLRFLACYYSIQFLIMNLNCLDSLNLMLLENKENVQAYTEYLVNLETSYKELISAYISKLLEIFYPYPDDNDFVICVVGTLVDQDDIDVWVIEELDDHREEFNRAIGKLSQQMLRTATRFHFYMSEHVGPKERLTTTIEEFDKRLAEVPVDVIAVTEILSAVPLVGSEALYEKLKKRIIDRYYSYHSVRFTHHERYLRGIIGEVRDFLVLQPSPNLINLKDDALRMIKALVFAGKVVHNIKKTRADDIIDRIIQKGAWNNEHLAKLKEDLAFFHIFRHLYQLFVVQDEQIDLTEPGTEDNLQVIAERMGYRDFGLIKAYTHLLVHYYERVEKSSISVKQLVKSLKDVLYRQSVFKTLIEKHKEIAQYEDSPRNAEEFVNKFITLLGTFRGVTYWDDVLNAFEVDNGTVRRMFINGFLAMHPRKQKVAARIAMLCTHYTLSTALRMVIMVNDSIKVPGYKKVRDLLNEAVLEALADTHDLSARFARLFDYDPLLVQKYLMILDQSKLKRLEELTKQEVEQEIIHSQTNFLILLKLHLISSNHYKYFLDKTVKKHPEFLKNITNTTNMKAISQGILGEISSTDSIEKKKELIASYFDIEFTRIAIDLFDNESIEKINKEYTILSDNYIQTLFFTCKEEIKRSMKKPFSTADKLSLLAAGGHARGNAFDDDYDIIVLLDSENKEIKEYCSKIVMKMHTEMVKQGVRPQFRFAGQFGSYVTLLSELEQTLSEDREDLFVDQSQVLGSRMLLGSKIFAKELEDRILEPYIYCQCDQYLRSITEEMEYRHARPIIQVGERDEDGPCINIKECKGGLRDIELLLLSYKSCLRFSESISEKILDLLLEVNHERRGEIKILKALLGFFRKVRNIYRLTIGASDLIHQNHLQLVANIMNFTTKGGLALSHTLFTGLKERLETSAEIVRTLNNDLYTRRGVLAKRMAKLDTGP